MFQKSLFLALVLFLSLGSTAPNCELFFKLEPPLKVSSFLEKRGLNSDLLTVERGGLWMSTYYKGEPLLEFTLFINFMDIIYPFTHSIEKPELLSKGLGSISYLLLARQLYLKTGKALGSDFRISTPAKNIWERFIVLGLAKKTGPIYQFKESVLNENSRWQEIDAILSRTPFEKGFFDSINKSTFDF